MLSGQEMDPMCSTTLRAADTAIDSAVLAYNEYTVRILSHSILIASKHKHSSNSLRLYSH